MRVLFDVGYMIRDPRIKAFIFTLGLSVGLIVAELLMRLVNGII